ncbi:MAG: cytochrome c5 family protein [Proteobacteria bacterium]|nr:cytochrome c5 family protein [Pseudomonadota bacterium]
MHSGQSFAIAVLVIASVFTLAACEQKPAPPTPAQLATLQPADPRLAQLYEHSCKACHTRAGSGAPLTHDHTVWDPRWDKGLSTLRDHAILGFQAMPAGGQCASCTAKDYEDLIRFLADRENEK